MKRFLHSLAAPETWVGIFAFLAVLGLGTLVGGKITKSPFVAGVGFWLLAPFLLMSLAAAVVLSFFVVTTGILKARRRAGLPLPPRSSPDAPPENRPPKFTVVSTEGSLMWIRVDGVLGAMPALDDDRALKEALGAAGYGQKVILDLHNICLVHERGLTWLLRCHRQFVGAGGKIVFHSAPLQLRQELDLLGLSNVLIIAADMDAARAILRSGRRRPQDAG